MHTRQGVAEPALCQHSARPNPNRYEEDAARRAALHQKNWDDEPLTAEQELLLDRLSRSSRLAHMSFEQAKQRATDLANETGITHFVLEHENGYKAVRLNRKNTLDAIFSEFIADRAVRA